MFISDRKPQTTLANSFLPFLTFDDRWSYVHRDLRGDLSRKSRRDL